MSEQLSNLLYGPVCEPILRIDPFYENGRTLGFVGGSFTRPCTHGDCQLPYMLPWEPYKYMPSISHVTSLVSASQSLNEDLSESRSFYSDFRPEYESTFWDHKRSIDCNDSYRNPVIKIILSKPNTLEEIDEQSNQGTSINIKQEELYDETYNQTKRGSTLSTTLGKLTSSIPQPEKCRPSAIMHTHNTNSYSQYNMYSSTTGHSLPEPLSIRPDKQKVKQESPGKTTFQQELPEKSRNKHTCDVCDRSFSRSSTLIAHKRIHTGEKPFVCETCGRAFRQTGNLSRHRLIHTTSKPYVCPHCSKAFNRVSNLYTHIRNHSNYKPHSCDICDDRLGQKGNINCYTHTG